MTTNLTIAEIDYDTVVARLKQSQDHGAHTIRPQDIALALTGGKTTVRGAAVGQAKVARLLKEAVANGDARCFYGSRPQFRYVTPAENTAKAAEREKIKRARALLVEHDIMDEGDAAQCVYMQNGIAVVSMSADNLFTLLGDA